jgi:hypothetical protein
MVIGDRHWYTLTNTQAERYHLKQAAQTDGASQAAWRLAQAESNRVWAAKKRTPEKQGLASKILAIIAL